MPLFPVAIASLVLFCHRKWKPGNYNFTFSGMSNSLQAFDYKRINLFVKIERVLLQGQWRRMASNDKVIPSLPELKRHLSLLEGSSHSHTLHRSWGTGGGTLLFFSHLHFSLLLKLSLTLQYYLHLPSLHPSHSLVLFTVPLAISFWK